MRIYGLEDRNPCTQMQMQTVKKRKKNPENDIGTFIFKTLKLIKLGRCHRTRYEIVHRLN